MKVVNTEEVEALISSGNLTVIDCFATWCGPCKAIKPILDKLSAELTNVTFVAVDINNNSEFARDMDIRSVPTLLFVKDGEVVRTVKGLQKEQAIRDILATL